MTETELDSYTRHLWTADERHSQVSAKDVMNTYCVAAL